MVNFLREDMHMKKPVYLDYNATTPLAPEVREAMAPFLAEHFGNPSSSHLYGTEPRHAVEMAREQVAGLLECAPGKIIFTSGGTEANNHAIKGTAWAMRDRGRHIITSSVEHPSVSAVCSFLEEFGFETTFLPVDSHGRADPGDVAKAIRSGTILITIMHANNEVGTIQPVAEIAEVARKNNIIFHADAAQSVGKIPTAVDELGVDMLTIAGHKLYAPKGVGALYVRHGFEPVSFCHGAAQEQGRRAGTENVSQIVGLGRACESAAMEMRKQTAAIRMLRDRLHEKLCGAVAACRRNGHPVDVLPNTLSISFRDLDANRLLERIRADVAASAGAACHSGSVTISHVLSAMHVAEEWARGTLRFSVGRMTTMEEIERAAEAVIAAVRELRS